MEADGGAADTQAYVAATEQEVRSRFGARVGRLRFFRLAARPEPESDLLPAYGLDQIFSSWVRDTPALISASPSTLTLGRTEREFARYRPVGI